MIDKPKPKGYIFGRPTTYLEEYCQKIVDYFMNATPYDDIVIEETIDKDGEALTKSKRVPNPPPSLARFAREEIGCSRSRLYEWAKKHTDFQDAIDICKEVFEDYLKDNALLGLYSASFAQFTAKNTIGWTDKVETKNENNTTIKGITIQYENPTEEAPKDVEEW